LYVEFTFSAYRTNILSGQLSLSTADHQSIHRPTDQSINSSICQSVNQPVLNGKWKNMSMHDLAYADHFTSAKIVIM